MNTVKNTGMDFTTNAFQAADQIRRCAMYRDYPHSLHIHASGSGGVFACVHHRSERGARVIVDRFHLVIPEGFDLVTLPGVNDLLFAATTRANAMAHMGREIV